MMRETEDGFRIAEADLKLRGEGEVLGTRQSGMAAFRLARIESDGDLWRPPATMRGSWWSAIRDSKVRAVRPSGCCSTCSNGRPRSA